MVGPHRDWRLSVRQPHHDPSLLVLLVVANYRAPQEHTFPRTAGGQRDSEHVGVAHSKFEKQAVRSMTILFFGLVLYRYVRTD